MQQEHREEVDGGVVYRCAAVPELYNLTSSRSRCGAGVLRTLIHAEALFEFGYTRGCSRQTNKPPNK